VKEAIGGGGVKPKAKERRRRERTRANSAPLSTALKGEEKSKNEEGEENLFAVGGGNRGVKAWLEEAQRGCRRSGRYQAAASSALAASRWRKSNSTGAMTSNLTLVA